MSKSRYLVGLVLLTFSAISLLTNIINPLIPDIIRSFGASLTAAGFLVFSFFIAYGVMSVPAGFLVERFSEKPVMIFSFLAATLGSLGFALLPRYTVAVASLFVIGAGMATLQVAIHPLLRVVGGEKQYAFNSVLAQLLFSGTSYLSPRLYTYLVLNLSRPLADPNPLVALLAALTPPGLPWVSIYWVFAAWALAVSRFWRFLTLGCLIGLLLVKLLEIRRVLVGASLGALFCLTAALFGSARDSLLAFPAVGLFASVMWPIIISLALNSVPRYHGPFSGILGTGIMGAAFVPVIIGRIGDLAGLRTGLLFLYLTFGFVLSVGFWARPLISNSTLNLKKAAQ